MREFKEYALYDSVEELIADINIGLDIEFNLDGQHYCIGGSTSGYFAAKAGDNYDDGDDYATAIELVDKYIIGDKPLRVVATQIRVTAA